MMKVIRLSTEERICSWTIFFSWTIFYLTKLIITDQKPLKTKLMMNKRFRVKADEYYVLVYIYIVLPRKVTKDHQSSSL